MTHQNKLLTFLCILLSFNTFAKKVNINVTGENIASSSITIFQYTDFVTLQKNVLSEGQTDAKGSWKTSFDLETTEMVYLTINNNELFFYAEPGKKYDIEINSEKKLNLRINDDGINTMISTFDTDLNEYIQNNFTQIYMNRDAFTINAILERLAEKHTQTNISYFEDYKSIRYAQLAAQSKDKNNEDIVEKYLKSIKIEAGDQKIKDICKSTLYNYASTLKLNEWITKGDAKGYISTAQSKNIPTYLAELLLLNEIKSQFDSRTYDQKTLLAILTEIEKIGSNDTNKNIATYLNSKLKHILIGEKFPTLNLADMNNETFQLDSILGQPIYIYFGSTTLPETDRVFKMLTWMKQNFKTSLKMVYVSCNEDFEQAKAKISESKVPVTLLNGNDNYDQLVVNFRLETFPRAYLLDHQGKVAISPALLPQNRFYQQFGSYLKSGK